MSTRTLAVAAIAALLLSLAAAAPPRNADEYEALRAAAERHYAEKSFRRAHELYAEAAKGTLTPEQERWVRFRTADTAWRSDAVAPAADPREREAARAALEELAKSDDLRIRAEAGESLGDFHAVFFHPGSGQAHYLAALDYWAGSTEIETARRRYLAIARRMASYGDANLAPREVLTSAIRIAASDDDRALFKTTLAMQLMYSGQPESVERALELFGEVIALGRKTGWYDDALYHSGALLAADGVHVDGRPSRGDAVRALEFFRRLVAEFAPGESPFRDDAQRQIETITRPDLGVHAGGTFLPQSDQEVHLSWRNVTKIDLAVYPVDLTRDATNIDGSMAETISIHGREPLRRWTFETNDDGTHRPGSERMRMNPPLAPGAWLVVAQAGGRTSRELVLVSDAHILVHKGRDRMQVYVSDVVSGKPIANAHVRVLGRAGRTQLVERTATTDANGLAAVDVTKWTMQLTILAAADGNRQAWHRTYHYSPDRGDAGGRWRIYAFTDRPAYRPGETVSWKIVARTRAGETWSTPANQSVHYEISSPRGEKVAEGTVTLNAFGSAWGELPLTGSMALGMYRVAFRPGGRSAGEAGAAELFRLEEYKLPEFFVRVSTPEGKRYRLGDEIEATVEASYYFGGPVANATVIAVIHSEPLYRLPWVEREYDWYFPRPPQPWVQRSVVREETLRTDAEGRAVLRMATPRDGSETVYRIEARVVDASRREVRGEGAVRVMSRRYAVDARPEHYVHRPGENATVEFRASDANGRPVETTGTVKVVRRKWRRDPIRPHPAGAWPRPPHWPGSYEETEILTTEVKTDAEGKAEVTFTPKTAGYYAVRWTSVDRDPGALPRPGARDLVTAETHLFVTDKATTDLGYHSGGLDLIVDRDSVRRGETASVIVVTPASGRWVVLSTSGDDLIDTQVLHLDGTAKLVQVPVDQRHVPNFFVVASSVFEQDVATDTERIVVPPAEHFLQVEVKADRGDYRPREEGTLVVTTRDAEGKPVAAEVALSVADEAVTAIQEDPAGDPRPFFFGGVREQVVQVSAAVNEQRYRDLEEEQEARDESGVEGGVVGGMVGDAVAEAAPPPPPAPAMARADGRLRNEAITVTAQAANVAPPAVPAPAEAPVEVQVRSDFRSTAFWKPDVVTGADGTARVTVRFPESLTTWRATARAATTGAQVGTGTSTARTNMPLMVRLQSPRFFVAGDRAVVSAVVNNDTDGPMTVTPVLEVDGLRLEGSAAAATLTVPPHGDARADWTVIAERAGTAALKVTARSERFADAMERSLTVWEHGIDKLVAASGKLRASEAVVRLDLPRERRATELTVQVAPSLATAMLDALPYLFEFPYGCTEQTMSRFLPAAMVARTLEKLGLERSAIERRMLRPSSASAAPGTGSPLPASATPGIGPPLPASAGRGVRGEGRATHTLDDVTRAGMARLYDMQHGDGGWGWWKEGSSDAWMTAYVVWGFSIAREAGLPVRSEAVDRGAAWLDRQLVEAEQRPDDQAWMLHALASWRATGSPNERRAIGNVWAKRERLSAYARALFAIAVHRRGDVEKARILVRNLEDGAQVDRSPDRSTLLDGAAAASAAETMATAHWGSANRFWWRWQEGPVETTAFVLRALVTIDPQHRLVEPAMNWLVKNRRGAQWSNTRDTAIALLALEQYLQHSGELAGDVAFEVTVNGRSVGSKRVTAADVLGAPARFAVDASALAAEAQEIRIRRTSGTAPLYFAAEARFVSLEEPVKPAGNELFVRREYFRLKPVPTLLKGVQYEKVPVRDGESVTSGDRVEVVVTIETKNDYEYLMFEDLKPAGFEAVELRSGEPLYATSHGRTAWVHQELRDRKVASFVDRLAQGVWELRYTLRAETPGSFHALPLLGSAMYVPEIRGNSAEVRVTVVE